ncbi:M48 family metallopeptidase [Candidatus Falkowbacteria bacterium]|nr:M48 family metallopeptidase [Candidatus Falkowbacteria bacterium]
MASWISFAPVKRKPPRRKRRVTATGAELKKYRTHREEARRRISELLIRVSSHYGLKYGRVAIRNQRRSWGSCSQAGNLNFNYRILFLPEHLQEYIVAHELCHLKEFNHGPFFWKHVSSYVPSYKKIRKELKTIPISSI